MLGQLLHLNNIDSVIVENRSKEYVTDRVRAGVLEQGTVDLMLASGVAARLTREGLRHEGVWLAFNGDRHHVNFTELTGKSIVVYGQNEILKDYIEAREALRLPLYFEASDVAVEEIESARPRVTFRKENTHYRVDCDFIAGCDGFHGICRQAIPATAIRTFDKTFPFAWLGILAHAAPSSEELVYALHERGFALYSMRSPTVTRLYLQCSPDEDIAHWPDERIWLELRTRLKTGDDWQINEGVIFQKGITPMRSFVTDVMRYGSLFLAGDAAHIVPPTGAKGLNLAAADIRVLAHAIVSYYRTGASDELANYSEKCLRRIWKVQRFSWWMTSLFHRFGNEVDFDYHRQLAELDYVTSSRAGMTTLAENYVGLPIEAPIPV
jgi:p-hydroxybenzoate 3-monooxygenase